MMIFWQYGAYWECSKHYNYRIIFQLHYNYNIIFQLDYDNLIEIRAVGVQNSGLWSTTSNKYYSTRRYILAYSSDGYNFRYVPASSSDMREKVGISILVLTVRHWPWG